MAVVAGWPDGVEVVSWEASGCDATGGVDAIPGGVAVTCASAPDELAGDRELTRLGYRSPAAVAPGSLQATVTLQAPSGDLALAPAVVRASP